MKTRSKLGRFCCALLAALLLVTSVGVPTESDAATKHPYYIQINRKQNCVTVYKLDDKGKYTIPVKAMACSVGVNNATPTGTFSISNQYRWHTLMGNVYGQYCSRIVGGVLFHSVYYSAADPSTLAYNSYNRLGSAASHGCVRLNVADAKWIYDNCSSGTKVRIYDGNDPGPLGKPNPVRIDTSSGYRGWDPTDPNPKNPWRKMAPTIKGVKNITVERCAKKPNLKKGITATDYKGKSLKIRVKGKLNMKKAGKYTITYQTTDSLSRTTTVKRVIIVKDTKKPTVTVKKKNISLTETQDKKLSEKQVIALLKKNVTAKDSGEVLSSKYVMIDADELLDAILNEEDGNYKVTVYAKDLAGNKSKKVTFHVNYTAPKDDTDDSDDPNTENPDGNNTEKPDDNSQNNNTENPDQNSENHTENPDSNQTQTLNANTENNTTEN